MFYSLFSAPGVVANDLVPCQELNSCEGDSGEKSKNLHDPFYDNFFYISYLSVRIFSWVCIRMLVCVFLMVFT